MPWYAYAIIALALVLLAAWLYDRRRRDVGVHGDSASRQRDLGRGVEHDNSGLDRKLRGGSGGM